MRLDAFRRPSFGPLAWILVALVWVAAYAVWLLPHFMNDYSLLLFGAFMVPVVIFALLVALAQQRWILGIIACVTVASPMLILMAGFMIFGF